MTNGKGATFRSEVWIGLIGALLGALVGGGATYAVAEQQIRATADSAAQQRHSAAIGTARLMRQEFDSWAELMQDRIEAGVYANEKIRTSTELEPATRLHVASVVDSEVWEKVAAAAGLAPKAQRLANRLKDKKKLLPNDRKRAPELRDAFRAASAALEPLATEGP